MKLILSYSYRKYILSASFISIIAGTIVIAGWVWDIESFKSVFPGLTTMKFNTSLCFILSGLALLFYLQPSKFGPIFFLFFSLAITLIGIISLSEDIFNYNAGLDEMIFADKNINTAKALNFPGRMASSTSFCFILVGFFFLLLKSKDHRIKIIIQFSLHLITLIAAITIMGYLYNVPALYKFSFLSSMAIHTSVIFFILSIGASLIQPSIGIMGLFTSRRIGSIMARRLFPLIALIIVILGYLRLQSHYHLLVSVEFGFALFTLSFLLVSLLLISITAKHLDKVDVKRNAAEKSLSVLNKNLEGLVVERTEDLRKISERLLLATKGSNIGIWDWDILNNKLTWDDKMYQLYGITASDFSGAYQAWENGLHPEDKEAGAKAIEQAITGEKDFDTEFRVIWPDQSVHTIKANSLIQRDASGKAIRMVGTNWDITEQKEQQETIRRSQEQYHTMIAGVHDYAILMLDKVGNIKTWNKGAQRIKGYTEQEIAGKNFHIFYTPEEVAMKLPDQLLETARKEGKVLNENWRVRKDGSLFWASVLITTLYDAEGNITGFTKVTRDLSEQRALQTINKEQEETIRLFVKHTPAAVAMFDKDMKYIIASDRWYKDYGLEGRQVIGESHYDIFPEIKKLPKWLEIHQRSLKGAVEINEEEAFPRADGKTDWLHWEIHPWKRYDGAIGGIIMFTEVITEKVAARENLKKLNEELITSNNELEQFAYVASHDLQEPLRMVSSFLQLLEKKYKPALDETAIKYIHFAVDGADRMKCLIKDLLSFSQVGSIKQKMTSVDIAVVLEETKSILNLAIEENGASIRYGLLPVIKADNVQIKLIFQNLIGNAIKYTGLEKPVIEIGYHETDHEWLFSIKDNGIGIEPKYFEKVFTMFQRLHTKNSYAGTGIGLAICKKIAEKHGGRIWVESTVGKGSTFYFTISKDTEKIS